MNTHRDSLYQAIEKFDLTEIKNVSDKLIRIDLTEADAFQRLKNLLLVMSAQSLFRLNYWVDAEIVITKILSLKLDNLQLYKLLSSKELTQQNSLASILQYFNPITTEDHVVFSIVYFSVGDFDKATVHMQQALALSPQDSDLYVYMGCQYFNNTFYTDNMGNAKKCFERSVELNPNNELAWLMLYYVSKDPKYCKKAIKLKPDYARARLELSFSYLSNGKKNAWEEYEYRTKVYEDLIRITRLFDPSKKWTGQSLNDKTIIVYCEQGFGDCIQFVRYVKVLKEKYNVKILLQARPELNRLFEPLADETFIIDTNEFIFPHHDYHVSMVSLPYLLNIPIPEPPVFITQPLDLSFYDEFVKIGICWSGNVAHTDDLARSCFLKEFKPLYDIPSVKLFSLQRDKDKKYYPKIKRWVDFSENPYNMDIVDLGSNFNDFLDAANAIVSMDLVITVDTAIILLAGSLGVPTWDLLYLDNDWRWGHKGETSPWFQSVRLYRQKQLYTWAPVIKKMKADLIKEMKLGNIVPKRIK